MPQLPPKLVLEQTIRPVHEGDAWFSTSEGLIEALGPHGQQYARLDIYNRKFDLSYVDPILVATDRKQAYLEAAEKRKQADIQAEEKSREPNVKDFLILYLRHLYPVLEYQARCEQSISDSPEIDQALLRIIDKKYENWLEGKGWDIQDAMSWAWILTADTSEQAATRLHVLTCEEGTKTRVSTIVPQSIFLFLLRRQNTSARALPLLLIHAWELMAGLENLKDRSANFEDINPVIFDPRDHPNGMGESVFMIMIIRLLRIALREWPAACESIVALICRYLDGINFERRPSQPDALVEPDSADLTYKYNTILKLLASPSRRHPFQSALFQQRAQFSILRRMNRFTPPLVVDRKGYRAVVRMQVMHKKTIKEREWADMKRRSWPPWKEEKLGIDAYIGVEDGISRAKEALLQSREAGYGCDDLDAAAEVLSGWDTDGSPTIQSRTILHSRARNVSAKRRLDASADEDSELVWTARIRATRTLDEAWSCFLAYKKHADIWSNRVYLEMLEKIVWDTQRRSLINASELINLDMDSQPMPGDGKEVLPGPVSPKEALYVPIPPPDIDGFLHLINDDNVPMSAHLLAAILKAAPSFERGLQCLEWSTLSKHEVMVLLNPCRPLHLGKHTALKRVPNYLLAAHIRFLVKYAPTMPKCKPQREGVLMITGQRLSQQYKQMNETQNDVSLFEDASKTPIQSPRDSEPQLVNTLSKAFYLLLIQRPWHRPAWYHVLRALARPKAVTGVTSRRMNQNREDIKTWQLTCRLLDTMLDIDLSVDLDGFLILCIHLEKAIFAAERELRHTNDERIMGLVDRVLSQGLPLIKEIFKNAVRYNGHQQDLPVDSSGTNAVKQNNGGIGPDDTEQKITSTSMDPEKDHDDRLAKGTYAFLPPACLLPKLLETPHPAQLHAFVRVLGLRRDWSGMLDLIEWMSLFADEIDVITNESMNGQSMMRRCLTATRVFLERSWMDNPRGASAGLGGLLIEVEAAPLEITKAVEEVVMENKRWGGWPSAQEVDEYIMHGNFL